MYLGQDEPEPGTPEFGAMAAARRANILSGNVFPSVMPSPGSPDFIGPVAPADSSSPDYGPGSVSATAAQRRAAIAATPIPATSGPPLLYLPAKYAAQGVEAAAAAAGKGLFSGVGPIVAVAAGVGLYFLFFRGRRG